MSCICVQQLAKLRKSSLEAVDNTEFFDSFNTYMHITRDIEGQLKNIIRDANRELNKCLIMLSGSTGDGKSHLISYLKNADEENLLEGYETYNDSTESDEPSLEFLEALAKQLEEFNDINLENDHAIKMIIAINLGIIGKLFDSEQGKMFTKLKQYVEENHVLSAYSEEIGYKPGSIFQHVSFADYQIFGLSSEGICTDYLEELFDRVFCEDEDKNDFYYSHKNCGCSLINRCPVYHNYELLQNKEIQKYVINRIVQVIIEDKAIMSTRDVLNLIYDILVGRTFSEKKLKEDMASEVDYLKDYIGWTTPMLLNEYDDVSDKLRLLKYHDVFCYRTEEIDNNSTKFHSMEDIGDEFKKSAEGTPYKILIDTTSISTFGGIKPDLKNQVYRFIVRLKKMNASNKNAFNERLIEYIKNIYYQNIGEERKLARFYDLTKNAILFWDGHFDDDYLCIDDTNDKYWILEQLFIESAGINHPKLGGDTLQRFPLELRVRFQSQLMPNIPPVETSIDYSLFELICDMEDGYKPSIRDKNLHTDFVSYIKRLSELGNKGRRVIIQSKFGDEKKYSFEKNTAGYRFKVI